MKKESLDRRDFLKQASAAGVGAFAASRGIDTRWMRRGPGHSGAYAVGAELSWQTFGAGTSAASPKPCSGPQSSRTSPSTIP